MCWGAAWSSGTRADSGSCWQDLVPEMAPVAYLQSRQHWGHRATEVSTDDHGNVPLRHWGLVQLKLPFQPAANPQVQHLPQVVAFVHSTCLAQRPVLAHANHLEFVRKHIFNDPPKICSVLLILYTFRCIWTHISASSCNLREAIGFYWLLQKYICTCLYSRYLYAVRHWATLSLPVIKIKFNNLYPSTVATIDQQGPSLTYHALLV